MKFTIPYYVAIFIFMLQAGCSGYNETRYFAGPIQTTEDISEIRKLAGGEIIFLDGVTYRQFAVYDTLMLFWHDVYPDHKSYSIFNLRTQKHINTFVYQGRGPHESYVGPIYQLYIENGNLKTILIAPNEEEMRVWNISASLKTNNTTYDTIMPLRWRRKYSNSYLNVYYRPDDYSTMIAYLPRKQEQKPIPLFEKLSLDNGENDYEYEIFRQYPEMSESEDGNWLYSNNCIKPDGSKIAMCMQYLCQINILDLNTGTTSFYRVKDTFNLRVLKEGYDKIPNQFWQSQCDDNYIYGLYSGTLPQDINNNYVLPEMVFVFDWGGNLVRKIKLQGSASQIWLDPKNNLLYTYNELNEDIYRYDLNEMNLN